MSENIGRYNVIFEILTKGINRSEFKQVKDDISELNIEHQKLYKELGKTPPKGSLASLRSEYNALSNEISNFTKAQRTSAEGLAKIKLSQTLKQEIRDIEKSLSNVNSKVTGLRGVFNTAKGAFAGIVAAEVVNTAIGNIQGIISKSVGLAAQFETTSQSFKVLLGDFEAAQQLIAELNEFSIKTPFEPAEIQASAKTLLGFGRTAKDVKEDIEIIGNASAATGANLQGLATVFGQVAGLGKLGGQDALQFINQSLPIYQILAESLGKSTQEVKKLQEQGKITFDVLREAFVKASQDGGKFAGALEAQSKTFNGLLSTVRGNIDEFLKNIGDAILPSLKPVLESVGTFFSEAVGRIQEFKPQIQEFFSGLVNIAVPVLKAVAFVAVNVGKALFYVVTTLARLPEIVKENRTTFIALGTALVALNGAMIVTSTIALVNAARLKAQATASSIAAGATKLLEIATKGLNAAFRANPVGIVVTAIALLVAGAIQLYQRFEFVRNVVAGLTNVFKVFAQGIKTVADNIGSLFEGGIGNFFNNVGAKLKDKFKAEFEFLFKNIENIVSGEDIKGGLIRLGAKILSYTPVGWALELGSRFGKAFTKGFDANAALERRVGFGGRGRAITPEESEKLERLRKKKLEDDKKLAEESKKTGEELLKEELERNKKLLEAQTLAVEKNYALREKAIRDEIKDEKERSRELQKLELENQIALLTIRQQYTQRANGSFFTKEDEVNFITLGNKITELTGKYDELFKKTSRGIDLSKLVVNALDPIQKTLLAANERARIEQEINAKKTIGNAESLVRELKRIQIESDLDKFDILKGFEIDPDRRKAIENEILTLERELRELLPFNIFEKKEDKKGFFQKLFNLSDAEFEEFKSAVDKAYDYVQQAINRAIDAEISLTERQIQEQEKRVAAAEKNAEKGKVEQLRIEEERLNELNEKRREFVEAQRAISQLEIVQSNAVAAATSIEAITKAFAKGNIPLGIATGIALAAQIAIIGTTIRSAFADVPAFKEGIEIFSTKADGRVTGPGTGKSDSVISRLSHGERVVDADTNTLLGMFPNKKLPEAVALYKAFPRLAKPIIINSGNNKDSGLLNEIAGMRKDIQSLKIVTKLDRNGFTQAIERDFENITRRNRIKG